MPAALLDTDVLSFLAKGDTRAALYAPELTGEELCVCFQTVAELHLWALIRHWGPAKRSALDAFLSRFVVLQYDAMMVRQWAEITAHRRHLGRPIECGDAWIAAAARCYGITLFSHNAADYRDIPGLTVVSHAD